MGKIIEQIVDNIFSSASITVIVIGAFVFIIGAVGEVPVGNPPLQIVDLGWRLGLAALGLVLVAAGLLFTRRELIGVDGGSFEVEARRYLDKPLLITSQKMNRQVIKSDFLNWEQCTIMLWVYVSGEGVGLKDPSGSPRYLLAHHTGKSEETEKYTNRFSFRYSTKYTRWEVVFSNNKGESPTRSDRPKVPVGPESGWHHFLVAWDRSKPQLRLLIDEGRKGSDLLTSPAAFSLWPERLAGRLSIGAGLSNFKKQYCETRLFKVLIFDSFLEITDSAVREHLKQKPKV